MQACTSAYDLRSDELDVLHRNLAARRQPWSARLLLERLQRDVVVYDVQATGLALWRYLGGPREALGVSAFRP